MFDANGGGIGATQSVGVSPTHPVKISSNLQGDFAVAWQDSFIKIQLYNKNGLSEGGLISTYCNTDLVVQASVVELTNDKRISVGFMQEEGGSQPPAPYLKMLDPQGDHVNYIPGSGEKSSMVSADTDYGDMRSVFTFSTATATYLSIGSKDTPNQAGNVVVIDNISSKFTQVAQNEDGSVATAWIGTAGGDLKGRMFHSSGHPASQFVIWPQLSAFDVASFDVQPAPEYETCVFAGVNNFSQGRIILQRFRYLGPKETDDDVINLTSTHTEKFFKTLSGANTHVIVWQYKAKYQSAILAQVYNKEFAPVGDTINITGFRTHGDIPDEWYFKFDAAIDSVGDFMVAWRSKENAYEIYASQYLPDGTENRSAFLVNSPDTSRPLTPHIGASGNGKFIITWVTLNELKAKLFGLASEGQETTLNCCMFNSAVDFGRTSVSINNNGKFVIAYPYGYYAIRMMIYGPDMSEVALSLVDNIADTNTDYDIAFSNADQIVLTWTVYPGVKLQRFDGMGVKSGPEVIIDSSADYFRDPAAYRDTYPIAASLLQYFSANGTKIGEPRRFNTFLGAGEFDISQNSDGDVFTALMDFTYDTPEANTIPRNLVVKGIFGSYKGSVPYYVTETINDGESFEFAGVLLTKKGRYSHLFEPDSLVILTLHVSMPPSIPEWSSVSSGDKFIQLDWLASSEGNVKHYRIYRHTVNVSANAQLLTTTEDTFFEDTDIEYARTYFYWLEAVEVNGLASGKSDSRGGMSVNLAPSAPKGLALTLVENKNVLSWIANTEHDISNYRVFRNTVADAATATLIASPVETDFAEQTVLEGMVFYWVKAVDESGLASAFSANVSSIVTGLPENPASSLKLYPNPTHDRLFIEGDDLHRIKSITIIDVIGRGYPARVSFGSVLDLANLPSGSYQVRIMLTSGIEVFKIVKL
jgi:hypothetical protein